MRIDAYNKITQVYQTASTNKIKKINSASPTDQLQISQMGKDYQVAKQAVAAAPDVRADKINTIKSQMASGNYNVSAEEVANKLVENNFNSIV